MMALHPVDMRPALGLGRTLAFQNRFLTLSLARIDQRHILKVFVRELVYAGCGVELLQRGHSRRSGGQLGRMRPQHGGRDGA